MILQLPVNKSPEPDDFQGKFYPTFREELTSILLKLSEKISEGGKLPNSFCEAPIILYQNQRDRERKKMTCQYLYEKGCKTQQNINKPNPKIHKKDHTP